MNVSAFWEVSPSEDFFFLLSVKLVFSFPQLEFYSSHWDAFYGILSGVWQLREVIQVTGSVWI